MKELFDAIESYNSARKRVESSEKVIEKYVLRLLLQEHPEAVEGDFVIMSESTKKPVIMGEFYTYGDDDRNASIKDAMDINKSTIFIFIR